MDFAEMYPARVLSQQKNISEHSDLYVTCSTFGFKKLSMVHVFLCKDGLGFSKMRQRQDQHDSTFVVDIVGLKASGNYSCVFSKTDYPPSEVAMSGHNIIQIQVIGKYFHHYKGNMSNSTHFLPLPCSQFPPCRHFSGRGVDSQRGRRHWIQMCCFWCLANTRWLSSHPVLPEEEGELPTSASVWCCKEGDNFLHQGRRHKELGSLQLRGAAVPMHPRAWQIPLWK